VRAGADHHAVCQRVVVDRAQLQPLTPSSSTAPMLAVARRWRHVSLLGSVLVAFFGIYPTLRKIIVATGDVACRGFAWRLRRLLRSPAQLAASLAILLEIVCAQASKEVTAGSFLIQ